MAGSSSEDREDTLEFEFAVALWLAEKEKAEYSSMVCRSFQRAKYRPSDWVKTLEVMPPDVLTSLLGALQREAETSDRLGGTITTGSANGGGGGGAEVAKDEKKKKKKKSGWFGGKDKDKDKDKEKEKGKDKGKGKEEEQRQPKQTLPPRDDDDDIGGLERPSTERKKMMDAVGSRGDGVVQVCVRDLT